MAPLSKLSPGARRPAGGSQVPVGRWSRSIRPSGRTGKMPETRSAFMLLLARHFRPLRSCAEVHFARQSAGVSYTIRTLFGTFGNRRSEPLGNLEKPLILISPTCGGLH